MSNINKRENIEIGLVIFGTILIGIFIAFAFPKQNGRTYDCGMAEWHPDIPTKVKEECRRVRAENFKEDLRKPK